MKEPFKKFALKISKVSKPTPYLPFIFAVAVSVIILSAPFTQAQLPGWAYHKVIEIKERAGIDLYDYQVKVVLNPNNFNFAGANPDGSDLRFMENGNFLPYWIERWAYGSEAVIWVKIPHLSPNETKRIDLYYGNSSALPESNLEETMDFLEIRRINTTNTTLTGENGNNPSTWTWDNVSLSTTFTNPVVIAQHLSYNNAESAVVRIKDTTSTSFFLRVIECSLRDNVHPTETVGALILNEGSYQFLDGTRIEAQKYETRSTVGANVAPDVWDTQSFSLNYSSTGSDPVVFAQPMSSNDLTQEARLVKTRLQDLRDNDRSFQVALEEEYNNNTQRFTTETIAWIALERKGLTESTTGTIPNQTNDSTPTPYQIGISYDNVVGIGNGWTTVNFSQNFSSPPILLLSLGSYDGGDNSELRYRNETTQTFQVAVEEDYTRGTGMEGTTAHTGEDVYFLAFGEEGVFPIAKRVDPEPTVQILAIKGRVFEDADASGDAFDPQEDEGKAGVRVRLYEEKDGNQGLTSGDTFITETQTDTEGYYFLPGVEGHTYYVVVNSRDIKPAPENNGLYPERKAEEVWAEQTYVKEYLNGRYQVESCLGGKNPLLSDNFTTSTVVSDNNYEHIARIDLEGENLEEIDFGFSFEVIVNTRDGDDDPSSARTIQGSLRQALLNASAIKKGQSINFKIPQTDPNYQSTNREFVITLSSELPHLTDSSTVIDGSTQTEYNQGKIVLDGSLISSADGLTVKGLNTSLKNLNLRKFNRGVNVWGWHYQKPITIDYSGTTTLTEYQVLVTITPSNFDYSRAQPDGSDIRFLSSQGEPLDYWIHNWDTSGTSRIWVKVPTIPPSSVTTITLLYGNPRAPSLELPYDLFSYSEIKTNKYVVSQRSATSNLQVMAGLPATIIRNDASGETVALNPGETHTFLSNTLSPTTSFSSNKPLCSAFITDVSETLVPLSFASTRFVYPAQRNTPQIDILSPFTDTSLTISVYLTTGTLSSSVTTQVARGESLHYTIGASPRVVIIESEAPVLATYDASPSDSFVMHPASTELFGVGSQNAYVAALANNTSVTAYLAYESGTQTAVNFTLNRGQSVNLATLAPYPFGAQGSGPSIHLIASNPIGVIQQADGDGLESTTFFERTNLNICLGIPVDAQYVAISAPYPDTSIWIEEPDGTTQAPVVSVQASGDYPGKFFFGSTASGVYIPAGSLIHASKPVYAYFEDASLNDEEQTCGLLQNRQLAYPEPKLSLKNEEAADSRVTLEKNRLEQNNKGVSVSSGNGIKITQNTFSNSSVLPIDLSDDSTVTSNNGTTDPSFPNKETDYPIITRAELDARGWNLYLEGYIGTDPAGKNFAGCTVEVYKSGGDLAGYGEGSFYLGSGETTSTNSFSFVLNVQNKGVTHETILTALTIDPDPSTSEFSPNTTTAGGPVISNIWAKHIYFDREATAPPYTYTTITWTTDISGTSQVVYDTTTHPSPTAPYAYQSAVNYTYTTNHLVTLTNLATNTIYYYRVKSTSTDGYLSISPEFKLPPGGAEADSDLCAACHRGHTAPHLIISPQEKQTPLGFPLQSQP